MKIRLTRVFRYQASPTKEVTLEPGVHEVSEYVANLAVRWGGAKLVREKKAPKNKARGKAPENKARVER